MNKKALVITIIVILFLIPLGIWGFLQLTKVTTGIQFIVVPDHITAKIDSKTYTVNYESIVGVKPGNYTIYLSADGFAPTTTTVTVTKDRITQVYAALTPETDTAKALLDTDVMRSRLERIAGHEVSQGAKQLSDKYPFINKLPITTMYYTINPCSIIDANNQKSTGICINLAIDNDYYRQQALDALKQKGIDTTNVTVRFSTLYGGD